MRGCAELRVIFGVAMAICLIVMAYPGPYVPLIEKVAIYVYVAFAAVETYQARIATHRRAVAEWHLVGFTIFMLGNAIYSLLTVENILQSVFWIAWLPGIYIERVMAFHHGDNARALPGIFFALTLVACAGAIWMLLAKLTVLSVLLITPVAHIGCISMLYLAWAAEQHAQKRTEQTWLDMRAAEEAAERRFVKEQTAARAQFDRINRSLSMGALDATVVHEISQPLAAMVTDAGAASRWLDGPRMNLVEARRAINRVVEDGHRAGAVLNSYRGMIRGGRPEREPVHLDVLVRETLAALAPAIRKNAVSVQTPLLESVPGVYGDRVQLHQLFVNLMSNAIDAMADMQDRPRLLSVRCEEDDCGRAVISVEDNGPGLMTRDPAKVFEPFFSTKTSGMGMGLFISRMIAEAHGGRLRVESRPGKTKFLVVIPTQGARVTRLRKGVPAA